MSFEQDWKKIEPEIRDRLEKACRAGMFQLCSNIIGGTPVDTGRAKANWFVTTGSASTKTVKQTDKSPKGQISSEKAKQVSVSVEKSIDTGKLYLTNNLPYIYRLEFDGWSSQARSGWIRKNVQEFNKLLAAQIRAVMK